MTETYVEVCLRCKATVDMGCCLCPDGDPGETAGITWEEHTAWREGVLPAVLTNAAAQAAHAAPVPQPFREAISPHPPHPAKEGK